MLSYILLELNLLLYNVHVLEVSHPERQLKHAVLNKLNPYIMGYAYRSSHGSNITDEYNMPSVRPTPWTTALIRSSVKPR
jgi:hypothetical protein